MKIEMTENERYSDPAAPICQGTKLQIKTSGLQIFYCLSRRTPDNFVSSITCPFATDVKYLVNSPKYLICIIRLDWFPLLLHLKIMIFPDTPYKETGQLMQSFFSGYLYENADI
jgi:hypothetical protein